MTTSTFTFSIRTALRETAVLIKKHLGFFLGIAAISIVLSFFANDKRIPLLVAIFAVILSIIWSIVWMKVSLAAARGEETQLSFSAIVGMLPTFKDFLMIIGIGILGGLIAVGGLILLVIPGIYIAVRLSFGNLAYLDRKEGIRKSLRYSWEITEGKKFWKVLLAIIVAVVLYMLGVLAFGIGLLIAYPLATIMLAKLYVALSDDHHRRQDVIVQPVEIEPAHEPLP